LLPLEAGLVDHLAAFLAKLEREALFLAYVDRAGAFLGDELITGGTSCSLAIQYRLVFERAFRRGAASLVLAHNHPSGCAEPSELDILSTRGLQALSVPMEMRLHDHLIVGGRQVFSMRAAGLVIS
jgi:DNA repair protein RadC